MGNSNSSNKVKDIGSMTSVTPVDGNNKKIKAYNNNEDTKISTSSTIKSKFILEKENSNDSFPSSSSSKLYEPTGAGDQKKIGKCEITSILGTDFIVSLEDMFDKNMMVSLDAVKSFIDQWNDVYISYNAESYEIAKTISGFLSGKGLKVAMPSEDLTDGKDHKQVLKKSRMVLGVINNRYIECTYDEGANVIKDDIISIEEILSKRHMPCLAVVDGPYFMDQPSCGDRLMNIYKKKSIRSTEEIYLDEIFFRILKEVRKSLKTITAQLSEINHDDPDSKFLPIYLNLPDSFSFDDKYIVSSAFYKISSTSLVFYGFEKKVKDSKSAVVIKFMKHKSDFEKEIKTREMVDALVFMPILAQYENHQYNVIFEQFGLGSFPHAIVMKKATKTLDSLISNEMGGRSPDWDRIRPVSLQIVRTLSRLHDKDIAFGNLDPTNIMCDEDNIKFIDLKSCSKLNEVGIFHDNSAYKAPECFSKSETGAVLLNKTQTKCTLAMDMWALGCVLYELFTCEALFHCSSNLSLVDINQVKNFSNSILKSKLERIENQKARDLLSILLVKDPQGRTDVGHIFSHSFFTDNRALSNVLNHVEQFDVFLSYRNFSDYAIADIIYKFLVSEGFSVFFDKLYNPNMTYYENMSYGLKNSRIFIPLVSRQAIVNFAQITTNSPVDSILIEYRLALEYKASDIIQGIVPVFIGDIDWNTGILGNFFEQKCFPVFPEVICTALEEAVAGDLNVSTGQPRTLKDICLSIFSLDSDSNITDQSNAVIYRVVDESLSILKVKLMKKVAKLEEKECGDMANDIVSKLKDLQSLGYVIKDKNGNVIS